MPSTFRPRSRRTAGQKKKARFMRQRKLAFPMRTFTEVYNAGGLSVNSGGVFTTTMSAIPQAGQYAALYKQFCIKKLEVTLIPRLNSFDPNTAGGTGLSFWLPRIAYSVDDSPDVLPPLSELDVLTDNGVKLVSMDKPIKMVCYPKPSIQSIESGSGNPVATRQKKQVWFNHRNPDVAADGWSVQHGSIRYWISANTLLSDFQFDVYHKVTFACRDPA